MKKLRELSLVAHKAIIVGMELLAAIMILLVLVTKIAIIFAIAFLVMSFVWYFLFLRCPHCGTLFGLRQRISQYCPYCGEELD